MRLLSTRLDGTIVKVNRTFETWTGLDRKDLLGHKRLPDLLTAGGRIYYETHIAPLLQLRGDVREIAVEIMRADGTREKARQHTAAGTTNKICRRATPPPGT